MPTIRRTLKNVVKNYSDAQVKVREATSNDPWGPSSTLMSEVADLSYNVAAFTEIMQMVWKRLNDDGKNWRHVYKALVLLDYVIKTGSEKVSQQCRENFHSIKTLSSFQHIDIDNKDQGINIREKAKQLVSLLSDEERLKNERTKALKAKERFAQNIMGIDSSGTVTRMRTSQSVQSGVDGAKSDHSVWTASGHADSSLGSVSGGGIPEMDSARPSSVGEEELQLQLALAMSKEEHEEEVRKHMSDELKLQMAIEQSRNSDGSQRYGTLLGASQCASMEARDPWGLPLKSHQADSTVKDPWGITKAVEDGHLTSACPVSLCHRPSPKLYPESSDPWGMPLDDSLLDKSNSVHGMINDPRSTLKRDSASGRCARPDAICCSPDALTNGPNGTADIDTEFDLISSRGTERSPSKSAGNDIINEFDVLGSNAVTGSFPQNTSNMQRDMVDPTSTKSPVDFLGAHGNLVNLDRLVAKPTAVGNNPFSVTTRSANVNPFHESSNGQLRSEKTKPLLPVYPSIPTSPVTWQSAVHPPFPTTMPTTHVQTYNPFL